MQTRAETGIVLRDTPAEVRFITEDIPRFWRAFDEAGSASDPSDAYDRLYLQPGSPGLRDFLSARIESAAALAKTVGEHPRYYRGIRANTLRLESEGGILDQIRRNFSAIEALYPEAKFQDVYFLIGRLTTGGTTSDRGLLLGLEMNARDASTPTEELDPWLQANTGSLEHLPALVTHEEVHTLQRLARDFANDGKTLLWKALQEGGADFVTSLVTQQPPRGSYFQYGLQHEAALWQEFKAAMERGAPISEWFYNGNNSQDRPADLGYFIGYRILEAYYQQATDKTEAFRTILSLEDEGQILEASGYAPT